MRVFTLGLNLCTQGRRLGSSMAAARGEGLKITAPLHVKNLMHGINFTGNGTWTMQQGPFVAAFLGTHGPSDVTHYNWYKFNNFQHKVVLHIPQIVPHVDSLHYKVRDLSDRYALEGAGLKMIDLGKGDTIGRKSVLACAGKGFGVGRDEDASNCLRKCGKHGPGSCECADAKKQGHACGARIKISQTLQQIKDGMVTLKLLGTHVPEGVIPVPPPLYGLRPDSQTLHETVHDVMKNGVGPTLAANNLMPALLAAADAANTELVDSSRYNIDPAVVEGLVKRLRQGERGEHTNKGDWVRTNLFVTERLIQSEDCRVLLFDPFPGETSILVVAPEWALELSRECRLAGTDSKYDTTQGCTIRFSTVRVSPPPITVIEIGVHCIISNV